MLRKILPTTPRVKEITDATSAKRWPTLWDHLTQTNWGPPDNQDRATSTITLFRRDDGSLGATLNDRDNARACFAAGVALLPLLDSLEAAASSEQTVWREDKALTGSSKRKK